MFIHEMPWNTSPVAARRFFVGRILGLFCLFALGCAFSVSAQNSVNITVRERAGVARQNEAVQFGVPIPRSWNLTNVASLRLRDGAGTPVAAQFEALARWGAALPGGRWSPRLEVEVMSRGESKFHQLRTLMSGSGVEVTGRTSR